MEMPLNIASEHVLPQNVLHDESPRLFRFCSCGEHALTLHIADHISLAALEIVQKIVRLAQEPPIEGISEIIPAYTTITFVFDVLLLQNHSLEPSEYIEQKVRQRLNLYAASLQPFQQNVPASVKILPVCYAEEFAPDLADLAKQHHISIDDVISLHSTSEYRAAMLGFTPGFPYLLGLPPELTTPRKSSPRTRIEAGSVGIAGEQTGIYPLSSPGGWNIIGRTPLRLFTPEHSPTTLLQNGDLVRFRAISREEFHQLESEARPLDTLKAASILSLQPTAESNKNFVVLKSGVNATIQDQGRVNRRVEGIPQSGAADAFSARIANALVGNASNDALLEIPFGQMEIRFSQETLIALTGIGVRAKARLDECAEWNTVAPMRPVLMRSGTVLRLSGSHGLFAYCAFAGGLDVPLVLGSRSTYTRAQIGGKQGRALAANDVVYIASPSASSQAVEHFVRATGKNVVSHTEVRFFAPSQTKPERLRLTMGNEWNEFDETSQDALCERSFRVQPASDRMGIRLKMDVETHNNSTLLHRTTNEQVISRAVFPGTLQCTPDGTLILLLADAQTTGGYPVIGHVCSADIAKAAQLVPHEKVRFQQISAQEARKLYIEQEQYLHQIFTQIQVKSRNA
jgi:KipI family sensor histidine kinase inhibitor